MSRSVAFVVKPSNPWVEKLGILAAHLGYTSYHYLEPKQLHLIKSTPVTIDLIFVSANDLTQPSELVRFETPSYGERKVWNMVSVPSELDEEWKTYRELLNTKYGLSLDDAKFRTFGDSPEEAFARATPAPFSSLEILRNISWMIDNPPSEAMISEDEGFRPMTPEERNAVVFRWPSGDRVVIYADTSRYDETERSITIPSDMKGEITVEHILQAVHNLYESPPNDEEIEEAIAEKYLDPGEERPKHIHRLMGDKRFFEGLNESSTVPGTYRLRLGS